MVPGKLRTLFMFVSCVTKALGRKWHERFDGEVQTRYRSLREPGACIKHFMKNNWLKMYDKLGQILRIETVINQPGEFKVFRQCQHCDGNSSTGYYPMRKGVGNLQHYQATLGNVTSATWTPWPWWKNAGLGRPGQLDAATTPARTQLRRLQPGTARRNSLVQRRAGWRPNRSELAQPRHPRRPVRRRENDQQRCRHSAAVGRLLKRLHVRGLLAKVPRTGKSEFLH